MKKRRENLSSDCLKKPIHYSYFKSAEIRYLLSETVKNFGKVAVFIADVPAIATYEALGYSKSKARAKAILKSNNLKNKTEKIEKELGLTDDRVVVIDWTKDVEKNTDFKKIYERIAELYKNNAKFRNSANAATKSVLENSGNEITNMNDAVKIGVHYLLSELAFLEFAPAFLTSKNIIYIYHKHWPVYEDYIAGTFDGLPKPYLRFFIFKSPA